MASLTIGCEDVFLYAPLARERLAAGLNHDHEVRILDLRLEERLDEVLTTFDPGVVGITSYTVHVDVVKPSLAGSRAGILRF